MTKAKKILYVSSEILPFLPQTDMSYIGRHLPQAVQESGGEIRSFMPKYGCINERRNQLHEVIRLSGMNIIVKDIDRPLIIKVASISAARMQVYFIDNEDYFQRKFVYRDDNDNFFPDNDERGIFFARGVLETVKKLRWKPTIVHCHGWLSHLLPLYLKKAYHDDPLFTNARVVVSLYNDLTTECFNENMRSKIIVPGIKTKDVAFLEEPTAVNLTRTAIQYADGVILANPSVDNALTEYAQSMKIPILPFIDPQDPDSTYISDYNHFYDQILETK
ncbi:MAG: glycogen/starch synthase [Bacteroidales bacterium]|jgi:starch synthase|nr:glycogen/starch synthase [Bacteroidales bacterium]MDD2263580.1 glycogen/starch synthase [Bacteroidales bacterium]MDD2830629.1 glycogen/starch synthase [Bacteroidales bacterium]MDD3208898.1 glycogen/starch synthase [Bacteroidales bacterium]MDD3697377.1 glycogen/starch synthase [Bacteroidales bacterium]